MSCRLLELSLKGKVVGRGEGFGDERVGVVPRTA